MKFTIKLSVIHLDEVYIVKTGHLIAEGGIAFVSLKSKQIHFDVQACSNAVIQLYHEDVAVPHYTEVRECKTLNQILQEKIALDFLAISPEAACWFTVKFYPF